MDVYNIDKTVTVEGETTTMLQYNGIKEIFEDTILPLLLQYDNVSLIGEYEEADVNKKKYVLDIGYDYLSLGFIAEGGGVAPILCKKEDIDNYDYILRETTSNFITTISGYDTSNKTVTIVNYKLRVISENNKMQVFLGCCSTNYTGTYIFALDVDNWGNKYLCVRNYNQVYYDDENYTQYSFDTQPSFSYIHNENYVFKSQTPIYKDSTFYGLSKNIITVTNRSLSLGSLSLIDIEDTKYRFLFTGGVAGTYIFYIDNQ